MEKFKTGIVDKFNKSSLRKQPDLEVHEDKVSYPGWAKKLGEALLFVWNKCLWNPFQYVWRFLNKWTNLTFWIFTGIFVGILVGYFQPEFSQEIEPLGTAFIRMIKIIVVPLIFSTLVLGIAGKYIYIYI